MKCEISPSYRWVNLACACCDSALHKTLGHRGGEAHRNKIGIRTRIVRCSSCGHIYPNPMPIIDNIDHQYYDTENYFLNQDLSEKTREYNSLLESLEKSLGYVGKLLDIGSGRGEMLYVAKQRGWESCGVEICREFAEYSRSNFQVEVKNCPLEDCRFADNCFDIVILNAVIEHLYYPRQLLLEINRIIKPNGLLWINTSNECSLFHLLGNLYFKIIGKYSVIQLSPTFTPYHVQGFTKNSIKVLLDRTGFRVSRLKLYSGSALLPHRSFREFVEYIGVKGISLLTKFLKMGRVMEIEARKL